MSNFIFSLRLPFSSPGGDWFNQYNKVASKNINNNNNNNNNKTKKKRQYKHIIYITNI